MCGTTARSTAIYVGADLTGVLPSLWQSGAHHVVSDGVRLAGVVVGALPVGEDRQLHLQRHVRVVQGVLPEQSPAGHQRAEAGQTGLPGAAGAGGRRQTHWADPAVLVPDQLPQRALQSGQNTAA